MMIVEFGLTVKAESYFEFEFFLLLDDDYEPQHIGCYSESETTRSIHLHNILCLHFMVYWNCLLNMEN